MKVKRVFQNKKKTFHICNELKENGLDTLWIPPVTPGDEKKTYTSVARNPPVRTGGYTKKTRAAGYRSFCISPSLSTRSECLERTRLPHLAISSRSVAMFCPVVVRKSPVIAALIPT